MKTFRSNDKSSRSPNNINSKKKKFKVDKKNLSIPFAFNTKTNSKTEEKKRKRLIMSKLPGSIDNDQIKKKEKKFNFTNQIRKEDKVDYLKHHNILHDNMMVTPSKPNKKFSNTTTSKISKLEIQKKKTNYKGN